MRFVKDMRSEGAHKFLTVALAFLFASTTLTACGGSASPNQAGNNDIHKVKHIVVIMQENRSFDTYFGTYPGADGIPAGVCVQNPSTNQCVKPFHNPNDKNFGGPHGATNAVADINGDKMDGFIGQELRGSRQTPGAAEETRLRVDRSYVPAPQG